MRVIADSWVRGCLAAVCLVLPIAACAQNPADRFGTELREVAGAASRAENVYYIRAFDGLVPVPNRYVLIARSGEVHEFNSFDVPGGHVSASGIIRVGPIARYEAIRSNYSTGRYTMREVRKGALLVERFEPIDGKAGSRPAHVLIRGDKEFLLVADENASLWEAMLAGCSCRAK